MARFTKTVDIWTLDDAQRAQLQPGQWVQAGEDGPKGRFFGQGRSTVCAWLGNARRDYRGYMNFMAGYGRNVRRMAH